MKELVQQGIALYLINVIGYIYASFLWKTHRIRDAALWPKIFVKDFITIMIYMHKELEEIYMMAESFAEMILDNKMKKV